MKDSDSVERFLEGHRFAYDCALGEIRAGEKRSHWIWYIFPQIQGLGHSPNALYYGISGLDEARAFLSHPILGTHLREITGALLAVDGKSAEEILSPIDALKVRSCMTLFDIVCPDDIFAAVLDKYYDGKRDAKTISILQQKAG